MKEIALFALWYNEKILDFRDYHGSPKGPRVYTTNGYAKGALKQMRIFEVKGVDFDAVTIRKFVPEVVV